jgi:hypothetical protein
MHTRRQFGGLVLAGVLLLAAGRSETAQAAMISQVSMFRNNESLQTGDGNSLSPVGSFLSLELDSTVANAYNSVTATYPGPGSPQSLPQVSPTQFHFQTGFLANQAAMDAAYPFGTYQFSASNGGPPDTTSFQYAADDYPQSQPFLTGTDYSNLQGMNASNPFTFHFSPFVTGGSANASFIFLTIFDLDLNAFVFIDNFLPATTTSVTLPANTLAPGHHFSYELVFDNRDFVPSPGAQFAAPIGFELRTDGTFTTASAAPEPASLTLLGIGALGLLGYGWRKRRQAAEA